MALADLSAVSLLVGERDRIAAALRQFDNQGRIVAMTIGPAPAADAPVVPAGGVQLSTARMAYPASMTDTIKGLLAERMSAIDQELRNLGVTGVQS